MPGCIEWPISQEEVLTGCGPGRDRRGTETLLQRLRHHCMAVERGIQPPFAAYLKRGKISILKNGSQWNAVPKRSESVIVMSANT